MRDRDIGGLKVSLDQEEQSKTLGGHHRITELVSRNRALVPFQALDIIDIV